MKPIHSYAFSFPASWPSNMPFCSLFYAHQLPPSFWFSHFQPVERHRNAFPWKKFWEQVPVLSVLHAAHSPMVLVDCTCGVHSLGMPMPRTIPRQYPAPGRHHAPGSIDVLPWPWQRGKSWVPSSYTPSMKFAQSEPTVLYQQNDHARCLSWTRRRHLFCNPLNPHPQCCAEAQRSQTINLPASFLILHFCISPNIVYLQQAVKRKLLNYFLV